MRYRFEDYVLDAARRELRRGAELIAVEPQVFDLLDYLIRHRDCVVSKDDLMAAVWNGRIVSESALTSRINSARAAIGDSGEGQRLIKTLRGKGFRFIGVVSEEPCVPAAASRTGPEMPPPFPDQPSIAVLPFNNLSGNPEQDYFSDGITEDIIAALSQIREFFVIARNSCFTYKNRVVDIRQIGRDLGVRYILEGSVRKVGSRVRVTAQLVEAVKGMHIWADHYDRNLEDIFAVQDEITQSVVGVLGPELSRAEQQRALIKPRENLDAWELYYRGMFHFYKHTREGHIEARRYFELAIERDPYFPGVYAAISRSLSVDWILLAPDRNASLAFEMARRAIELDPRAAMSHYALGVAHILIGRNGEAALQALKEAMTLNPNDALIHNVTAVALISLGRADEAISYSERAIRLSPSDSSIGNFYGWLAIGHLFLGRHEAAVKCGQVAAQKAGTWLDRVALPAALAELGRDTEAKQACEEVRSLWPNLSIQTVRENEPVSYPLYLDTLLNGLRKAGLSEQ